VRGLERIIGSYPFARDIHLVMDNLNIHCCKKLTDHFGQGWGAYPLEAAQGSLPAQVPKRASVKRHVHLGMNRRQNGHWEAAAPEPGQLLVCA